MYITWNTALSVGKEKLKEDKAKSSIILFDGYCNLCNSTVRFVLTHDRKKLFCYSTLQSETSKLLLEEFPLTNKDTETVVLIRNGKKYLRSTAILQIFKLLGFPWSLFLLAKLIPINLLDKIYSYISARRYKWFGKRNRCMVPNGSEMKRFL